MKKTMKSNNETVVGNAKPSKEKNKLFQYEITLRSIYKLDFNDNEICDNTIIERVNAENAIYAYKIG